MRAKLNLLGTTIVALCASSAGAATLTPGFAPVSPNGNGTLTAFVMNSPMELQVADKDFSSAGPLDILLSATTPSGSTEQYVAVEQIFNGTGIGFASFVIELGTGTGDNFVAFDGSGTTPFFSDESTSGTTFATASLSNGDTRLTLSGGAGQADGSNFVVEFLLNVPDNLSPTSFTLRQSAVPVPEPIALGGIATIGLVALRRRRA